MKVFRISYGVRGFASIYADALKWRHMLTDKAKYKVKVLVFWEKHGLEATMDAFPHKRSTLYLWKKKLKESGGRLESLNDKSKSPKNKRKRMVDPQIKDFIINLRINHPRTGKDKIAPLLGKYCLEQDIKPLSSSTIGRVLSDLKEKGVILSNRKLTLSARTGRLIERKPIRRKKTRRKDYQPQQQGDLLQIDTIVLFINGIKRYIATAIDLRSDFAFAYGYKNASSLSVKDFFVKLEAVCPFRVQRIQTDNGSEFESYFREYIDKKNIIHFHNYPKCPRMNAVIERFNRTIQEEFINWNKQTLADNLDLFNQKLMAWLLWYNTERPHYSLQMISPLQSIINNSFLTPEKSNMLWTHTEI